MRSIPFREALLKQAFAGFAARCGRLIRDLYGLERHPLPDAERGTGRDILYYSVEDNKAYLTPPQDEEAATGAECSASEYPMVFDRADLRSNDCARPSVGERHAAPGAAPFVQAIVKTANVSKFDIARPSGAGNLGKALAMRTSCR